MERKRYKLSDHLEVECPSESCVFCEHCESVFWDYTNGIYMLICELDADTDVGAEGKCKEFAEEQNE